jgi:hypothetical protein
VGNPGQRPFGRAGARAGGPNDLGELAEPLDGDGIGDLFHALKVLVQHRLAVLDFGRQPTGGHRVPALGFGQRASRCDDQLPAGGALTRPAILNGHTEL